MRVLDPGICSQKHWEATMLISSDEIDLRGIGRPLANNQDSGTSLDLHHGLVVDAYASHARLMFVE